MKRLSDKVILMENFKNDLDIENVFIEPTVCSLGKYAFQNCSNIRNVTIEAKLRYIGKGCFSGCTGVSSIIMKHKPFLSGGMIFDGIGKSIRDNSKINLPRGMKYEYIKILYTSCIEQAINKVKLLVLKLNNILPNDLYEEILNYL